MFGIGIPEILIIAFVAIVFLNPRDLPGLFRNLGKSYQQVRRMREDFIKEVNDIKNGFDVVGRPGGTTATTRTMTPGAKEGGSKPPLGADASKDGEQGEVT